jgi:CheY-like chemotaxis protein
MKARKPVVLIYDINTKLVDAVAHVLSSSGLLTTINTYNEGNATEVLEQYNRGFGLLTNKLSCVITGWNSHKKPRDQFLYLMREMESKSPLRRPTSVIIITEDHRPDLKQRALEAGVVAYLHIDTFKDYLLPLMVELLEKNNPIELNQRARLLFAKEQYANESEEV